MVSKVRLKNTSFTISWRNTWASLFSTGQGRLMRHVLKDGSSSTDVTKIKPVFTCLTEQASKVMLMYLDLEFGQFRLSLVLRYLYCGTVKNPISIQLFKVYSLYKWLTPIYPSFRDNWNGATVSHYCLCIIAKYRKKFYNEKYCYEEFYFYWPRAHNSSSARTTYLASHLCLFWGIICKK